MGYQESYVKMKNNEDFDKLLIVLKELGKDFFISNGVEPVRVITLKKPLNINVNDEIYNFQKGEKFIYIIGERFSQKNSVNLLNGNLKEDIEIYFTEYFPSKDIFENNGNNDFAIHEEFKW